MASAEQKIFKCGFYTSAFVSGLKALRESSQLSDVTLKVQDRKFSCHKLVLAANSKYFLSIFTAAFKERGSRKITMPAKIEAEAMDTLLDYFYSGELVLSPSNVESVFIATDYMRLDPLLEICIEYMQDTLHPSNCIRRYVMADPIQYSSRRLDTFRKAASALVVELAVKDSESADFMSLSPNLIIKLVQSNSQPDRAESLYPVILNWVRHDEKNRRQFLCNLLQTLRVDGISDEFFASKIKSEELLRGDPKNVDWLLDNFALRRSPLPATTTTTLPRASAFPTTTTRSQSNSLFLACNDMSQKCFQVKVQNLTTLKLHDRPEIRYFSAICHKKRIYLVCGSDRENAYQLDSPQEKWKECELDLKFGRRCTGCVVDDDDLYVVGGREWVNTWETSSCFKLSFASGRRVPLPAMTEARCFPGAAIYANSVYAACGASSRSSIERFDPREGRWFAVGRYGTKIGCCSSATIDDYLYSCDADTGSLERFDFRANRSQRTHALPSGTLSGYHIASMEGCLFGAVCGRILKYDCVADKWNDFCDGVEMDWPVIVPWEE